MRSMRTRVSGRAIAASAGLVCATTPAFGIAEAINTICQTGPAVETFCQFYVGGAGPLITQLPTADQRITGSRSILGLVDALLPRSSHEAFTTSTGASRVLLEITSTGTLGEGLSTDPNHVKLRNRSTGVLHAMIGDGTPRDPNPLARCVSFTARASVGAIVSNGDTFVLNVPALTASLLIMSDRTYGAAFGVTQPADAIAMPFSYLGDFEGEGLLARICDAVVWRTGVTLVAPTGDGAFGPFPPNNPNAINRTVGSPAASYNVIKVGGFEIARAATPNPLFLPTNGAAPPREPGEPDRGIGAQAPFYRRPYNDSRNFKATGRGQLDVRNWRRLDASQPSGFATELNVRAGVDLVGPAESLRLALSTADDTYSRDVQLPQEAYSGSNSTTFAPGFVVGAVGILQDAFRVVKLRLGSQFPQWNTWYENGRVRDTMPNVVVKAILLNSAFKSGIWTNVGNQGSNSQPPDYTNATQPMDTIEGAGFVDLRRAFVQFQGRPASGSLLALPATMDAPETDPRFATRLLFVPPGAQQMQTNADPPLAGYFNDPVLGEGGSPNPQPSSGRLPPPDIRNPNTPRLNPQFPPPPSDRVIGSPVFVRSIGWDYGKISTGFIDYALVDPLNSTSDNMTFTLCWNRMSEITFPPANNLARPVNLLTDETRLQFENLDLEIYLHDGNGNPRGRLGRSVSTWSNVEHVYLRSPQPVGQGALPLIRVRWIDSRYNNYLRTPVADVPFGLAWQIETITQLSQGGGPSSGPPPTPIMQRPGDANHDGLVNITDMEIILQAFGSADPIADLNHDGRVDFKDLAIVLSNMTN